jgi:hypothetical protein
MKAVNQNFKQFSIYGFWITFVFGKDLSSTLNEYKIINYFIENTIQVRRINKKKIINFQIY